MTKKKKIVWSRVFAFVGMLVTLFVVIIASSNRLPSTTFVRSLLKPQAATQKTLNVLEIRYFPSDPNGTQLTKTNALSSLLLSDIAEASKPRGYKDANATSVVVPVVKRVVTRAKNSPYTTGTGETFYESLKTMLSSDGEDLCAYIAANKIDQVWFWKDVGVDNGGFNQEYFMSWSNAMLPNGGYPPVCNGQRTFLILGLDQNRTVAEALHSFGHSIEATIPVLQGTDLFWTKWAGGTNPSTEARTCGNVHFPPNTGTSYDYTRTTGISTNCEDWHADGTGTQTNVTCTRWGCNQEGYMKWWLQNTPNSAQGLTYGGKVIPTWWSFLADTDNGILDAAASNQYLVATYATKATPGPTATAMATPAPTIIPFATWPPSPSTCLQSSGTYTLNIYCKNDANAPVGCGALCTSNADCNTANGFTCKTIVPQNQPYPIPTPNTTSRVVKLVNHPINSAQAYMDFDGIYENNVTVQETSSRFTYVGTWYSASLSTVSGGTTKFTGPSTGSVQFTTTTSNVFYIGALQNNMGYVDVYVNNVLKGSINLYNAGSKKQQAFDLSGYLK